MTTIITISAIVDASDKTEAQVTEAAQAAATALNATLVKVERYQKNWRLNFETSAEVKRVDVHDTLMSVLWSKYRIDNDWAMLRLIKREVETPVVVEPAVVEIPAETPCYQQEATEDEANDAAITAAVIDLLEIQKYTLWPSGGVCYYPLSASAIATNVEIVQTEVERVLNVIVKDQRVTRINNPDYSTYHL